MFFPLLAAAQPHGTAVMVHGTGPRTRAKLRELGLDRYLVYRDGFT
ncbi:hypothetical protein AB0D46_31845 [Streptomyces sp. NPDC048383]